MERSESESCACTRAGWAGALVFLLAAACGPSPVALQVNGVSPTKVAPRSSGPVTLTGTFMPELALEVDGATPQARIENDFEVYIDDTRAPTVGFLGPNALTVSLPPLEQGTYSILVRDPQRGMEATLSNQLQVVYDAPTQIAFTANPRTTSVNSWTDVITIALEDELGNPTVAPQQMLLQVTSDSATGQMSLNAGLDSAPVLNAVIPQGTGSIAFSYRDSTAGVYTLTAKLDQLTAYQQVTVQAPVVP
jgi:hypothetical protein